MKNLLPTLGAGLLALTLLSGCAQKGMQMGGGSCCSSGSQMKKAKSCESQSCGDKEGGKKHAKMCGNKDAKGGSCGTKGEDKEKHGFISMVMKLDLTPEQRAEIQSIKDAFKMTKKQSETMIHPSEAFSETSFDKARFIELATAKKTQKMQKKIEQKADMMEKIYTLLTPEQKKALKALLSAKAQSCQSK